MKVDVKNPNGIITNAFIVVPSKLATCLFINSASKFNSEKWVRSDGVCSGPNDDRMEEIEYEFYMLGILDDDFVPETDMDTVTITAENEAENKVLMRLAFELHTKGQLWYMYCDESVYSKRETMVIKFLWWLRSIFSKDN